MRIEDQVRDLIEDIIVKNDYKLDDVLYTKEGNMYNLAVVIDKEGYIDIEDCVKVSNLINPILDKANLIEDSYVLDVCSREKGGE
ncbi:MAG: hypothetical protein PHD10_03325 [Bacilli bacterium]|nr:hypothetical protein [Bacilli bacterium]MDD4608143.1 hypothetical protein [Bacilli bacterium]